MKKKESKTSTMKKCAVLLAAAMLLATGCGKEDEKTIGGSVQNMEPVDITSGAGGAGAPGDGEAAGEGQQDGGTQEGQQDSGQGGAASGAGYQFTAKGVTIEMDADAAPVLEQLGEPVSYFEAASCAFEGLDKTYTYNGFELDTYPTGDKDYISMVVLKDDSVATPEGIAIGDTLEKLTQAYPEGSKQGDNMLVCEKGGMKLCFILQGDEVKSIEYRSTVLE